jgi:polyisoprenoid-binding protein YceI
MKKRIFWQEVLLKKINFIFIFFILIYPPKILAKERWLIDSDLSSISFEIPVLFLKNVQGTFNTMEGYVEIDLENYKNNKAIFSVDINSIKINYNNYYTLLMSEIFLNEKKFPKALIDTRKFSYENQKELIIDVEIMIKGESHIIPTNIKIKRVAEKIIQIQSELSFSRTEFNIGIGKWSNTTILKDNAKIRTNIFLFKE